MLAQLMPADRRSELGSLLSAGKKCQAVQVKEHEWGTSVSALGGPFEIVVGCGELELRDSII